MPCEVQNLSNLVEVHSPRGQALIQLQVPSTKSDRSRVQPF